MEIQQVMLTPGKHAEGVPANTVAIPLLRRVDGFPTTSAALGEEATICTIIGRTCTGVLNRINSECSRSFGETIDEILTVGTEYKS